MGQNQNFRAKSDKTFGQKETFWSKRNFFFKNKKFGQQGRFLFKVKILVRNQNFG